MMTAAAISRSCCRCDRVFNDRVSMGRPRELCDLCRRPSSPGPRQCRGCDAPIPLHGENRGRHRLFCEACRPPVVKRYEWAVARCMECGKPTARYNLKICSKVCRSARKAQAHKSRLARGHRAPSQRLVERVHRNCTECDTPIPHTRNNGRQRQCSPRCRRAFKDKALWGGVEDRCRHFGVAFDKRITIAWVLNRDGYRCCRCRRQVYRGRGHNWKADNHAEIHHILWLCWCISGHTADNVETLCRACHYLEHWGGKGSDMVQHPLFAVDAA